MRKQASLWFVGAVLGLLAYGTWLRFRTPSVAEALDLLVDGPMDREARMRCLRVLRDQPVRGPQDLRQLELRASAALLLDDAAGYRAAAELVKRASSFVPGGPDRWSEADLAVLGLGEPCLLQLLRGIALRNAGDHAAAAVELGRAKRSARLYDQRLIEDLAGQ